MTFLDQLLGKGKGRFVIYSSDLKRYQGGLLSLVFYQIFRPSADGVNVKENGHDASSTATANKKTNNSRTQEAANETRSSKSPTSQAKEIPIEIKSTTKSKQEEQKVKTSSKQQEQKQKSSSKQQEEPKQNNTAESKPPQPPAPPMPPPPMPGLGMY
jgi:hypothetical protein